MVTTQDSPKEFCFTVSEMGRLIKAKMKGLKRTRFFRGKRYRSLRIKKYHLAKEAPFGIAIKPKDSSHLLYYIPEGEEGDSFLRHLILKPDLMGNICGYIGKTYYVPNMKDRMRCVINDNPLINLNDMDVSVNSLHTKLDETIELVNSSKDEHTYELKSVYNSVYELVQRVDDHALNLDGIDSRLDEVNSILSDGNEDMEEGIKKILQHMMLVAPSGGKKDEDDGKGDDVGKENDPMYCQANKVDLKRLENKLEKKLDEKVNKLEKKMDEKVNSLEKKLDEKVDRLEDEMKEMKADMKEILSILKKK